MKFMKYLLALAIALCATASGSRAQTVQFLGGGSSALFLELGQAAQSSASTSTPCVWTQKSSASILARDDRPSTPTDEQGNIWITWGAGTGTCAAPVAPFNIYSYMSLDSVVGDRCYFMVDGSGSGCLQILTVAAGTAGANLLGTGFGPDTAIPANVISALNNQQFFAAGTDIRPEDAKFAVQRMFTACGSPILREPYNQTVYQTTGLGYQTSVTGVGAPVLSAFSAKSFNVLQFNITGKDPISGLTVRPFTVTTVGAQPIVIAVSPATGTGIAAATDVDGFTLALFMEGVYGRSTDLQGPTTTNPVTTLVREPLSGTYNTFEYSNANSSQFKTSQDASNCSGASAKSNPLNIASANGQVAGAARKRVIGTGEMVATLQAATTDTLGYFFWSAANASNLANAKYLTVNGVDPIADSYSVTNGVFPTAAAATLGQVTFKNLNAGDYPIWSALRLVSTSPTPAGVTALVAGVQTLDSTQHDFITLANLKVWHSHFNINSIGVTNEANGTTINPATPGDLCGTTGALPEGGGDAGGTNVQKKGNHDFCSDFGNKMGLVNKNN
jgi:hypothetical protein